MIEFIFGRSGYEIILRYIGHPLNSFIKRRNTFSSLREKERLMRADVELIREHQFRKLKEVLEIASRHVPFYRDKFREIRFDPERLRSLNEYRDLEFCVTKEDIRPEPSRFISDIVHEKYLSWHRTGGSTGEPLLFATDSVTDGNSHASLILALNMAGANIGDRHCLFWGSPTFIKKNDGLKQKCTEAKVHIRNALMNRKVFLNYNLSESNVVSIYKNLERFQPRYLRGMPASLYTFCSLMRSRNLQFEKCKPLFVHSACETLFDWQKEVIENSFGCPVLNTYGLSEFGDIAFEAQPEQFLIMEDSVFLELKEINEIEGGEREIIASQLCNVFSPLLKYKTGDVAEEIVSPRDGKGFSSLSGLKGRAHDFVRSRDGRYLHGQFFTHILVFCEGIKKFQVRQDRKYDVTITLVVDDNYDIGQEGKIIQLVRSYLGEEIAVDFVYTDEIALTERGKHKWIISEVNPLEEAVKEGGS